MSGLASNLIQTPLQRYRGDTSLLRLVLRSPDTGSIYDPTGSVLLFTLKANADDTDSSALIQKLSAVGGFTIVDATAGRVDVELVPADVAILSPERTYEWDVQAQSTSTGAVKTVARGTYWQEKDVTRGTTLAIPTTTTNPNVAYTWSNIPDKPSAFTPTMHASTHAIDGDDELTPEDIGAETPAGAQAKADAAESGAEQTAANALAAAVGALIDAAEAANSIGNTEIALPAGCKVLAQKITFSGAATPRIVVLKPTNAVKGAVILLTLLLPATAGITVQVRDTDASGTVLATVSSDGTAGQVGILITRGASAWNDPLLASWTD